MSKLNTVVSAEIPVIRKILDDETWLEGERRGCAVSPHDVVVRENVCAVVLRIGADLRRAVTSQLKSASAGS
jgi:hypothetical protein